MASTKLVEANQTEKNGSVNKIAADKEKNILMWFNIAAWIVSILLIIVFAFIFAKTHWYCESDWVLKHEIVGTYGDFVGGVLGTLVALYSAYLLVRTLRNQLEVNSNVMDTNANVVSTNKSIVKGNSTIIYQTYLQIFDNAFNTFLANYKESVGAYQFDTEGITEHTTYKCNDKEAHSYNKTTTTINGRAALEKIADHFSKSKFNDNRTYLNKVKKATLAFENLYSQNRHEMSVHFRNLYLLARFIAETNPEDEEGNIQLNEDDRVIYAKCLRGQLSEGEMLLLRYNCLSDRGAKMRPFVNQFNLTKHLPIMSLLEFKCHRQKLGYDIEASTLDAHFIELRKRLKLHVSQIANSLTGNWEVSARYKICTELSTNRKSLTLKVVRTKILPRYGSDGRPPIDITLNRFVTIQELMSLYTDFMRETFIVSNFYLFNGKTDTNINYHSNSDADAETAVISIERDYPIVIAQWQLNNPA